MEANELRIGNWLNWNGSPSQIQSGGIHLFEEGKLHIEPKPIPLTEEWLVRFGFQKTFDSPFEDFEWTDHNMQLSENLDCYLGKFTQPIKHVHQLQNLYFALTGEELKLTEK